MERRRLRKLRDYADVTIDTSGYTVHQVKALVMQRFRRHPRSDALSIHLLSFGYKTGIPLEADLLFDSRFLPNPYFIPRLKGLPGTDKKVSRYLRAFPETKEFVKRIGDLLQYLLPHYAREGKSNLTVAIGCTGGRHRSVFLVEEIAKVLKDKKRSIHVRHRDVEN